MHDTARQGIAIGFFDGVHLGHRRILADAKVAVTFRNHPLSVIAPNKAPRLIMPFCEREAAIRSCGVTKLVALDFTKELAAMEPEDFAEKFLDEKTIYCGANWRFGNRNRGDAKLLASLGYDVRITPFAEFRGERISSSRIRAAIEDGGIAEANAMLGRPWRVAGRVVAGKGLGRKIGFPTINLVLDDLQLNLPRGVYTVHAGGCRAVANWGIAPTMRENAWKNPVLEVHLLEGQWAGEEDREPWIVEFLAFIRPEKRFDSLDALKAQIAADVAAALSID